MSLEIKEIKEKQKEIKPEIPINPNEKECEVCGIKEIIIFETECTKQHNIEITEPILNCKCLNCINPEVLKYYCSKKNDLKSTIHWICKQCYYTLPNKRLLNLFNSWNDELEEEKSFWEARKIRKKKTKL